MTVRVDQLESDVTVETAGGDATPPPRANWEELARLRALRARDRRDRLRTAAEGHDD